MIIDTINKDEDGINNLDQFNTVCNRRLSKIKSVLLAKGKEYAKEGDRYHNFNVAARVLGSSREKALLGMMMKHYVSILDIIEKPCSFSDEMIDEKIGDMINYLILLEGMLLEQKER